jgi:hypothetical protein
MNHHNHATATREAADIMDLLLELLRLQNTSIDDSEYDIPPHNGTFHSRKLVNVYKYHLEQGVQNRPLRVKVIPTNSFQSRQ